MITIELSTEIDADVRRLAARSHVAPTTIALAAFCALVHRYTGDSRVAVGVNSGGECGGDLVTRNMRVVQIDLANDPTFNDLLAERNIAVLEGPRRVRPGTAEAPVAVRFGALDSPPQQRPFDELWIVAEDDGRGLRLAYTGNAAWVGPRFTRFLQGAIARPTMPISRVALLGDEERRSVLNLARGKHSAYERDATVHALFARQAQAAPDAIAVCDDRGALSYGELERRANQLAHHLRSLGVTPGVGVGVSVARSLELPVVLLAVLKAGGVYVPLDAAYPRERLAFVVEDAGIRLIVTTRADVGEGVESGGGFGSGCGFAGAEIIDLGSEAAGIQRQPTDAPATAVGPESVAYIAYTSGSTGRPKGVAVMHRGVVRLVRGTDYIAVRSDDVFLQCAPVGFDASTFELWAPLLNGARVAIPRPGLLSMFELSDTIARFGVTVLFLTTSLFQKLVEGHLRELRTLRLLLTGGEVASPRHMVRFLRERPGCELMAVYGPTENTTFSTWCELPNDAAIGRSVPIGRPIANSSAYVLDRHGELVPVGAVGELWVGGDGVAQGYVNLPELTQERFVRDPFSPQASARMYRTGDRVRLRPDGILEFLGRNDDQVKIRGHRVELGEIESALQAHRAVLDAAVVVAHDTSEKALVAFVSSAAGAEPDERGLRAFLTAKLPSYMLPNRFAFVDRLPQGPSGKLDRTALAAMASAPPARTAAAVHAAPGIAGNASALQGAIAAVWSDVLELNRTPGADENFFDAGGDSLRLLAVHERLVREFSVRLSIVDLFEHSTVRKLADLIGRSRVCA